VGAVTVTAVGARGGNAYNNSNAGLGAAGGAGGYSGGGAGGATNNCGGGGSYNAGSSPYNQAGIGAGNGQVVIDYLQP
jgi:hypothetical protein